MKKMLRCLAVAVILLLACSMGVSAAGANESKYTPAKVKTLKVKNALEDTCKLYWARVPEATGYYIYSVKNKGKVSRIGKTTGRTFIVKKMKVGKEYRFQVVPYREVKGKVYLNQETPKTISVTTGMKIPERPTDFSVVPASAKSLKLSWQKADDATGYEIVTFDKDGEPMLVKKTSRTSVTISGLKTNKEYSYAVRSYRKVNGWFTYSKYTKTESGKPSRLAEEVNSVRTFYYTGKTTESVEVYNYTTGKNQVLPSGTPITSKLKIGTYLNAYLRNGDNIKIKRSAVNIPISIEINPNSDYSKGVKEAFVNSKGATLSSRTDYLIWISHYRAMVNIFKGSAGKWKLIKEFPAAIGRVGSVRGLKEIQPGREYSSFYDAKPMIPWSEGGNAFHCMMGARVGTTVSGGCIRLEDEGLYYIYRNIPDYTRVYSY